jgi:DNA-binding NarL/FixJ family response regulator
VRACGAGDEEAGSLLESARAVAERLGMRPLLGEIDSLARRARLRMAAAAGSDDEAAANGAVAGLGLTPRELEVLQLVAEGCTNREIGERLFMSEKTASVHVSRIIAKLGAANRTEAAASAQRLGLVGAR